jgi:hypothetical protein
MQDSGGVKTGLAPDSEGLQVAYVRDGDSMPVQVSLEPWDERYPVPGAFREIDPHLMPGLYELLLPSQLCAEGANRATLLIQAPGIHVQVIHLHLVAYDPYDRERLGLDCLSREGRHEVISRAFREVVPEIVEEFRRRPELPPLTHPGG